MGVGAARLDQAQFVGQVFGNPIVLLLTAAILGILLLGTLGYSYVSYSRLIDARLDLIQPTGPGTELSAQTLQIGLD